MNKKIEHAVIHGRFQPPHNGHIKYIVSALEKADHVLIGICTPKICTPEESKITGYPCTQELNPFTYEQRSEMITRALKDLNISKNSYTIIPFPSDYKNVGTLVPNDTIFFMSYTGEHDTRKINYIESLGYKTQIILSDDSQREESGEKIRKSIKEKNDIWKNLVPRAVKKFIEDNFEL